MCSCWSKREVCPSRDTWTALLSPSVSSEARDRQACAQGTPGQSWSSLWSGGLSSRPAVTAPDAAEATWKGRGGGVEVLCPPTLQGGPGRPLRPLTGVPPSPEPSSPVSHQGCRPMYGGNTCVVVGVVGAGGSVCLGQRRGQISMVAQNHF